MSKTWSQAFRYWLLTIVVIAAVYAIWYTHDLYTPLLISVLLTYILNPFVEFFSTRTKLSRSSVVAIVFIGGILLLTTLAMILIPPTIADLQVLVLDIEDILVQAQDFISQPIIVLGQEVQIDLLIPDLTQLLSDRVLTLPENALHFVESITKNSLWVLVVIVATYYMLRDWTILRSWGYKIIPEEHKSDARNLYMEIREVWHGYFQGNLALMLIVGVVFSIAWLSIGLPAALTLGIITGLLTIIPELGPAIAAGLAILVALFEGSTYLNISNAWFAVLVFGIYLVLITIKNLWVRPLVFSRSVHMHEAIVFIAIMGAAAIQGVLGALVIIPLLATLSVIARYLFYKLQAADPWEGREDHS